MTVIVIMPPRCYCGDRFEDHLGDKPGEIEPGGACTRPDCNCPAWLWHVD